MDETITRWEATMAQMAHRALRQRQDDQALSLKGARAAAALRRRSAALHPLPPAPEISDLLARLARRRTVDEDLTADLEMIYATPAQVRDKLCAVTIAGRRYLRRVQAAKLARHMARPEVRSLRKAILWERRHGELASAMRPT